MSEEQIDTGIQQHVTVEQTLDTMRVVFDHYLNHHRAILKKLQHARTATQKSYEDLHAQYADIQDDQETQTQALAQAASQDTLWEGILDLFRDYGATEDELHAIDDILTEIPRAIKRHYDVMVQQDKVLQDIIVKLHSEEYQSALEMVKDIQMQKNPLSGFSAQEYDVKPTPILSAAVQDEHAQKAYRFDAPSRKS